MTGESTREGDAQLPAGAPPNNQELDNDSGSGNDTPVDPRMAIMEAAAEAAERERMMDPETRQEDMSFGEPVPEEGLQYRGEMNPEPKPNGVPEGFEDDPLSEFIELNDDGEPMFRMVVNGQKELIPLDKARASLQKGAAADQKLKHAAEVEKEAQERLHETLKLQQQWQETIATAQAPSETQNQGQPSQADAGLTDEELEQGALDVAKELYTGSTEDAATKLAGLLKKARGVPATPVDEATIVNKAATAAVQAMTEKEYKDDAKKGFNDFKRDYPEVFEDKRLYAVADSMASTIAEEHPDWKPSQVMQEAGEQVRKWVKGVSGDSDDDTPKDPASEQNDKTQSDRRERKRQTLRPLPRARQGTEQRDAAEEIETPADIVAATREARGQAV